jgi:hypothetical protein
VPKSFISLARQFGLIFPCAFGHFWRTPATLALYEDLVRGDSLGHDH